MNTTNPWNHHKNQATEKTVESIQTYLNISKMKATSQTPAILSTINGQQLQEAPTRISGTTVHGAHGAT